MTHTYNIEGMTCNGCKASVEKNLLSVPEITDVTVELEKGLAIIHTNKRLNITALRQVLPAKFTISDHQPLPPISSPSPIEATAEKTKLQQLKPLFLILGYISIASVLMHHQNWDISAIMLDFMGLFYIVFSFFKMLDLKGFAKSFSMYDPLAKQIPAYANIYPFIETALGLMFLLRFQIPIALVLTLVILGITTIGVTKTLLDKKTIQCACLGTALKLPMTEATFLENAIMIVMAVVMLTQVI